MRSAIIKPLSAAATHWTGRRHYSVDTAALLLAGADPASIDAEAPENITVRETWAAPAFAIGPQVWRERLVRAALTGDLAASMDGEPGTVGIWGSNERWSPMAVSEAARPEKGFEVRSRNVFFDIDRRELSTWLEKEGLELPFWLAAGADQGGEPKSCQPSNVDSLSDFYVLALRLAAAGGLELSHPPGKPGTVVSRIQSQWDSVVDDSDIQPPTNSRRMREVVERAANHDYAILDYPKKLQPGARKSIQALFHFAAGLHKKQLDLNTPYTAITHLESLMEKLPPTITRPNPDQWRAVVNF